MAMKEKDNLPHTIPVNWDSLQCWGLKQGKATLWRRGHRGTEGVILNLIWQREEFLITKSNYCCLEGKSYCEQGDKITTLPIISAQTTLLLTDSNHHCLNNIYQCQHWYFRFFWLILFIWMTTDTLYDLILWIHMTDVDKQDSINVKVYNLQDFNN